MIDVSKVQLTAEDLSIDLPAKLLETEAAIQCLDGMRVTVRPEARELAGIMRRAIVAERELARSRLRDSESND